MAKEDWRECDVSWAHDYADSLDELLPLIADAEYIRAAVRHELARKDPNETIKLSAVLDDATLLKIRSLTNCIERNSVDPLPPQEAANSLSILHKERADRGRHERLMAKLRPIYFIYMVVVILSLLVLLAWGILGGTDGKPDTWARLLVVGAGGALGSVLAATLKLRDVVELHQFRGVVATLVIQPLIGASFGFASWLILTSGAVTIGRLDMQAWQTQAVVAFASGFSEPFFLGIIGRVMGRPR